MASHCIWSPSNCQKHVCTKHSTSPSFFKRSLYNTSPNLKWRQMKNSKANWSITCVLQAEISHLFGICLLGFPLICPMWAIYNARVSGCPENLLLLCLTHSKLSLMYQFFLWNHGLALFWLIWTIPITVENICGVLNDPLMQCSPIIILCWWVSARKT